MKTINRFLLQSSCAATAVLLSSLTLGQPQAGCSPVQWGTTAFARSSGGRSGGGSFRGGSGGSGSFGGSSRSFPRSVDPGYRRSYGGGPVFVPVPYGGSGGYGQSYGGGGGSFFPLLVLLLLGGAGIAGLMWFLPKMTGQSAVGTSEVDNNIFAISKVQVALYAQARELQSELTELSLEVDTDSSEGLLRLLQESTLSLLRHTEYWTHVSASSQIARDALQAQSMVNALSIEQRRQLSSETLVNVGGNKKRSAVQAAGLEEGPAAYIVVTFLIGTAHDKPLFSKIQTETELQAVLQQLASLPAEYLMTFELIWSPQEASDSLTDDELLTEYSDLVQI